jgi:hypothetical protein
MTDTIETIVVLADETASCLVAGLTQLERLLREIERCARPSPRGAAQALDIVIVWRMREFCERQPAFAGRRAVSARFRHVIDGEKDQSGLIETVAGGRALILATNQVWAPGGLRNRLSSQPTDRLVGRPGTRAPGGLSLWESLVRHCQPLAAADPSSHGGPIGILKGPDDVPRVERALFKALGKPSDGYMTRFVNRRLSTSLSRHLARTRVTPNQISWLVAALFLASAWSLVGGGGQMLLLGTVLYKLGDILDGCDGELARVKFMESRFGAWLDTTIDMIGNMLFIAALAIGLSRGPGLLDHQRGQLLWEGLLTTSAMAAVVWAMARHTRLTSGDAHFAGFGASLAGLLPDRRRLRRSILILSQLVRRDAYSWAFVGLAWAGMPAGILHAQAVGVIGHALGLGLAWRLGSQRRSTALEAGG